uniref:Neuropeptide-like 4 n=1 Tax=Strongyloides stercoralis TaxID=6248 RepID=A0A0K0E947_STRER
MNTKFIVAIIAVLIATISGQYYYAPSYAYASYYPYAAPVATYASVAAPAPVVAAPVVPSAFAPVAYAIGSNKGKNDTETPKIQENVKLTN